MTSERTGDTFAPAGPDRWSVRLARRYPHPVETVWRAVSEPAHLEAWFPSTVELDLRVGAEVRFGPPMEGLPALTGVVTDCEPPYVLGFTWDTDHVRFELSATDDGTELVLLHTFDDRAGAASFGSGWDTCGVGLSAHLAGEPAPEPDPAAALHEELIARFGLDQPAVDEVGPDGRWTIVFERQTVVPEPAVRDLLEQHAPTTPAADIAFVEGTGHGARLVVTITGSDPADRDAARVAWRQAIEGIAAEAADHALATKP